MHTARTAGARAGGNSRAQLAAAFRICSTRSSACAEIFAWSPASAMQSESPDTPPKATGALGPRSRASYPSGPARSTLAICHGPRVAFLNGLVVHSAPRPTAPPACDSHSAPRIPGRPHQGIRSPSPTWRSSRSRGAGTRRRTGPPCSGVRGSPSWLSASRLPGRTKSSSGRLVVNPCSAWTSTHRVEGWTPARAQQRLQRHSLEPVVETAPAGDAMDVAERFGPRQRLQLGPGQAERTLDGAREGEAPPRQVDPGHAPVVQHRPLPGGDLPWREAVTIGGAEITVLGHRVFLVTRYRSNAVTPWLVPASR